MNVTLVRHGETDENVRRIVQGQLPGHLTEKGRQQSERTAQKLSDMVFDAIYCSDQQRCIDTAEPIRRQFPDIPFVLEPALRERKSGEAEGKIYDEAYWNSLPGDEYTRRYPGGESWEDVRTRMRPFLNELFERYPGGSVLIVTHGGPVRGIRSLLEGRSLEDVYNDGTPNAGIWEETMTEPLT